MFCKIAVTLPPVVLRQHFCAPDKFAKLRGLLADFNNLSVRKAVVRF